MNQNQNQINDDKTQESKLQKYDASMLMGSIALTNVGFTYNNIITLLTGLSLSPMGKYVRVVIRNMVAGNTKMLGVTQYFILAFVTFVCSLIIGSITDHKRLERSQLLRFQHLIVSNASYFMYNLLTCLFIGITLASTLHQNGDLAMFFSISVGSVLMLPLIASGLFFGNVTNAPKRFMIKQRHLQYYKNKLGRSCLFEGFSSEIKLTDIIDVGSKRTYLIRHHRSDGKFRAIMHKGHDAEIMKSAHNEEGFIFAIIPAFSGKVLYRFSPTYFGKTWIQGNFVRYSDGKKPDLPKETMYSIDVYKPISDMIKLGKGIMCNSLIQRIKEDIEDVEYAQKYFRPRYFNEAKKSLNYHYNMIKRNKCPLFEGDKKKIEDTLKKEYIKTVDERPEPCKMLKYEIARNIRRINNQAEGTKTWKSDHILLSKRLEDLKQCEKKHGIRHRDDKKKKQKYSRAPPYHSHKPGVGGFMQNINIKVIDGGDEMAKKTYGRPPNDSYNRKDTVYANISQSSLPSIDINLDVNDDDRRYLHSLSDTLNLIEPYHTNVWNNDRKGQVDNLQLNSSRKGILKYLIDKRLAASQRNVSNRGLPIKPKLRHGRRFLDYLNSKHMFSRYLDKKKKMKLKYKENKSKSKSKNKRKLNKKGRRRSRKTSVNLCKFRLRQGMYSLLNFLFSTLFIVIISYFTNLSFKFLVSK
ncbi:hypothetical protein [Heterosigma akashiwo virus 01]|uniref:Uncharacterized protein n=1 Tax=Heterosigma akashiwo virus 01 TaxID=97195 RepID=A0A1C9C501_HAV01|nr:hypothetical protein D1R72_gp037 [Heterosigma akashiwo virus 01]AOM63368.1 hypothetical protein [Heterosigma akashiwo virus 01]